MGKTDIVGMDCSKMTDFSRRDAGKNWCASVFFAGVAPHSYFIRIYGEIMTSFALRLLEMGNY